MKDGTGTENIKKTVDRKEESAEVAEAYVNEVQVINPTLTLFSVGGKKFKIREMNIKKSKELIEMITETVSDIFGGGKDIKLDSADAFLKFIDDVPQKKINEFINFVFGTKDEKKPMSKAFIEENFTPRLVQELADVVIKQNCLEKMLDFLKGQAPKLISLGEKTP